MERDASYEPGSEDADIEPALIRTDYDVEIRPDPRITEEFVHTFAVVRIGNSYTVTIIQRPGGYSYVNNLSPEKLEEVLKDLKKGDYKEIPASQIP